ncbi:MAG: hypothetical protein ACKOI2_11710 [Actinomycetota bacterium]
MPFCSACARYWTPTAMEPDGSCPVCHRALDTPSTPGRTNPSPAKEKLDLRSLAAGDTDEDVSAPWHFKLLVASLVLYLGWRVVDLFI